MNTKKWLCFIFGVLFSYILSPIVSGEELKSGSGSFIFETPQEKKSIRVWYYKPKSFKKTTKIVFVMHGVKRDGEKYRDAWLPYAKKKRFLLLVPEFSIKDYPNSLGYNLGNMHSSSGEINDEALWSYTVIEDLFDYIKTITPSKASFYDIYGHSAGAQFVHRLVMFKPKARIRIAIAANAGWYTMPTDSIEFPYGLKDSGTDINKIVASFGKNLIILLGEKDTDENHKYLRKTPEAMLQGKHRLERGQSFYETAKKSAKEQRCQFKWKLKTVPSVGHSNSKMAAYAAKFLR
jgi:hypothetical protein